MSLWEWLFRRGQREEEPEEEIQAHLNMAAQERMEQGESAEQARTSAIREFGNVALVKIQTSPWRPELRGGHRIGIASRLFRR
jgi:hypothetical protein